MKIGTKTHYCNGSRQAGGEVFGRLVNLYVRRGQEWMKVGTLCSNCGAHWINGVAYEVPRPASTNAGKS